MNHTYESPLQADLARALSVALTVEGFVVVEGEYDMRRTVELVGTDGSRTVTVPLHQFFEGEPGDGDAEWLLMVRSATGQLLDSPETVGADGPFGCPSVWDVVEVGFDVDAGYAELLTHANRTGVHGFVPARGVLPGSAASRYAEHPYPGNRPAGSWVVDADSALWPVMPDSASASGWSVVTAHDIVCLDVWLGERGAAPLAERVPVLSYGSNANPAKFVGNGVSLPGVNLAVRVHDLASVYCAGTRSSDGGVPATLTGLEGRVEDHVVSYVVVDDFEALDDVEGRWGHWYDLEVLTSGRVVRCDGSVLGTVFAYVGGRPERYPLVKDDAFLLVSDTTQDEALAALARHRRRGEETLAAGEIGAVWPDGLPVTSRVDAVFVYGTLMPGEFRWSSLAPYAAGEPQTGHVTGELHDTGHGYPALFPGDAPVPGFVVRLAPETRVEALELLDVIEGTDVGLYARAVVGVDGTAAFVYVAADEHLAGTPIAAWPVSA